MEYLIYKPYLCRDNEILVFHNTLAAYGGTLKVGNRGFKQDFTFAQTTEYKANNGGGVNSKTIFKNICDNSYPVRNKVFPNSAMFEFCNGPRLNSYYIFTDLARALYSKSLLLTKLKKYAEDQLLHELARIESKFPDSTEFLLTIEKNYPELII